MKYFGGKIKKELRGRVEKIKALAKNDDEGAHTEEDDLRARALKLIASKEFISCDCVNIAKVALETEDVDFARWCA